MPFDPATGKYISMDDWRKARAPALTPSPASAPTPAATPPAASAGRPKSLIGQIVGSVKQLGARGLSGATLGVTEKAVNPGEPQGPIETGGAIFGNVLGPLVPISVSAMLVGGLLKTLNRGITKVAPNVATKVAASPSATKAVSLLRAVGKPAAVGAVYEGTKAAVAGEKPADVAKAAERGAVFFGAAGVAGNAAGQVLGKAVPPALAATRVGKVATGALRGSASGAVGALAEGATYPAGERPTGKDIAMTGAQLGLFEAILGGLTGGKTPTPEQLRAARTLYALRGGNVKDIPYEVDANGRIVAKAPPVEPAKVEVSAPTPVAQVKPEVLTVPEAPPTLKVGARVRPSDRRNLGTVVSVDEAAGKATVLFVNRKAGTKSSKEFAISDLADTKGRPFAVPTAEAAAVSEPTSAPATPPVEAVSRVSEKADPQTVQTRTLIPASELSDVEIAQRIKAQFPNQDRQSAYSRYVQALDLKPRIDASNFFKLYDSVGPNWHYRTENVAFRPTHIDTATGTPVAAIKENGYYKILWQNGRTGSEPGEMLPERYRPVETTPPVEAAAGTLVPSKGAPQFAVWPKTPEELRAAYDKAQAVVDNMENALSAKYGEGEVLAAPVYPNTGAFADLPEQPTRLTPDELAGLRRAYGERDAIGERLDQTLLANVMTSLPAGGPASREMVENTLRDMMKEGNLRELLDHGPQTAQQFVERLYNGLSHELAAVGELPTNFAGDLAHAMEVAKDPERYPYGTSPEPLLRQVKAIADTVLGKTAQPEPAAGTPLPRLPEAPAPPVEATVGTPAKEPWQMTEAEAKAAGKSLRWRFDEAQKALEDGRLLVGTPEYDRIRGEASEWGYGLEPPAWQTPASEAIKTTGYRTDVDRILKWMGLKPAERKHLMELYATQRGTVTVPVGEGPSAQGRTLKPTERYSKRDADTILLAGHHLAVERALAAGKPVPPEILAEYPDLAAKPAEQAPSTVSTKPVAITINEARAKAADILAMKPPPQDITQWSRRTVEAMADNLEARSPIDVSSLLDGPVRGVYRALSDNPNLPPEQREVYRLASELRTPEEVRQNLGMQMSVAVKNYALNKGLPEPVVNSLMRIGDDLLSYPLDYGRVWDIETAISRYLRDHSDVVLADSTVDAFIGKHPGAGFRRVDLWNQIKDTASMQPRDVAVGRLFDTVIAGNVDGAVRNAEEIEEGIEGARAWQKPDEYARNVAKKADQLTGVAETLRSSLRTVAGADADRAIDAYLGALKTWKESAPARARAVADAADTIVLEPYARPKSVPTGAATLFDRDSTIRLTDNPKGGLVSDGYIAFPISAAEAQRVRDKYPRVQQIEDALIQGAVDRVTSDTPLTPVGQYSDVVYLKDASDRYVGIRSKMYAFAVRNGWEFRADATDPTSAPLAILADGRKIGAYMPIKEKQSILPPGSQRPEPPNVPDAPRLRDFVMRVRLGDNAPAPSPTAGESNPTILKAPPGVPQGVSATGRPTINPGTVRAIVNTLGKLGAPIRVGRLGNIAAQAIYKVKPEVIRTRMAHDIQRISHDIGHHLDKHLALSSNPAFQGELEGLAQAVGAQKDLLKEGAAEYVRLYLTDPVKGQEMAPEFAKHFEQVLAGNKAVTDALDAARQQIRDIVNAKPEDFFKSLISVGEKPKPRPTTLRQVYARFIDELAPIRRAVATVTGGKQLSATEDPYTQARLGRAWAGKASAALNNGVRDAAGREIAPALMKSLKPVSANLDNFRSYLVARRTLEIADRVDVLPGQGVVGRDGVLERARATVERLDSQVFRDAAGALSKYQDAILRATLVDSGMLSEAEANRFLAESPAYVPFYRVIEELDAMGRTPGMGRGFVDLQKAIKKMRGDARTVIDPLESIIKNTYLFTNLAERNRVGRLLADLADKNEGIGQFIEEVSPKKRPIEFPLNEIKGVLAESGVDLEGIDLDASATIFRAIMTGSPKENVSVVWRDGKAHLYQFDPDIYEAMKWLDRDGMGKLVDVLHYPAAWLRAGAVQFNPVFLGFNPIRDNVSAFVYSKYGFVPGFDFVKGLFHVLKRDEMYELFQSSGAAQSAFVSLDRNFLQKDMRSLLGGKKGIHPLEGLQTLSEAMEQATRMGEFERAVKKEGLTREGLAKAALAAREVTLDFSRSGSWTHGMNRITAFFNANLQGTDKMVRAFKENPVGSTLKAAAIVTLPSIALYLINRNNPYYRELSEYEKDYYWHIPFTKGNRLDILDGKADGFLRIPKPFELGILFGALPERVLTWLDEKERGAVDAFAKEMKPWLGSFINGITPSIVPTAASFPVELFANRDLFQGRQIVPDREKELPKELQYGPYTSETGKLVGKAFNISPRYFDQFIRDYFAGTGKFATDATDAVLRAAGLTEGEIKSLGNQIPLVTSFYARPYAGTSDSIEHFYDVWNRAEAVFNGRQARLKQNLPLDPLTPEEAELIGGLNTLRYVGKAISDLRAIQRTATFSPNLSPKERQAVKDYLDYYQINYARFLQGLPMLTVPDETAVMAERALPGVVQEQKTIQQRLEAVSKQLRRGKQ